MYFILGDSLFLKLRACNINTINKSMRKLPLIVTYCYEPGMSLSSNVSPIGKRHLQRFYGDAGPMEAIDPPPDLGDKTEVLENARIFSLSLLGAKLW
ncbi:hypothetical protein AVEN_64754-1 [Araneus ventricosus]|uniref:Uncharacterized protein n=1 Tax=Araneus ventricosus TaxID=182803 RepID=A0A4Y2T677_ARAVE|nr:hypothetical protein AVEN_64754-1 [Araneus ventricosus]